MLGKSADVHFVDDRIRQVRIKRLIVSPVEGVVNHKRVAMLSLARSP